MAKRKLASGYRERSDGRIESRFTIAGKRYSVYDDTLAGCKAKEAELREQIKNGSYVSNRNVTFHEYYEEWKKGRAGTVKGNTVLGIESRYKNHIKPVLGHRKMIEIEKREIVRLQQLLAEKQKASTVNTTIVQIKAIFNSAVEDGVLTKSPAAGVKLLRDTGKAASETYHRALTVDEQDAFVEEAKQEWLYELLVILLLTGLRIGEAAALLWSDVDYVNQVIHVTKTVSRTAEGSFMIGTPKSKTGIRDIPLTEPMKVILKSQKEKLKLVHGNVINISQGVFENFCGGVVYNASANKAITNTLKRLEKKGIYIEHFSAHALRDTFATRYIEYGGTPQTLKTILGHSSLAMTMDLYSHVLPNTKQEEMRKVSDAFKLITG